jgi:UBA-like domain
VDDEKKSLAIMNLQAILNLDDMDIVIQLLEHNNWDESVRV